MWNDKRSVGILAGFLLLAGIAVAGWVRHASPAADSAPLPLVQTDNQSLPRLGTPVSGTVSGSYVSDAGATNSGYANSYAGSYQQDGYYSSIHRPLSVRADVPRQPLERAQEQPESGYRNEPETVYRDRRGERVYRGEVHHGRSTGKSVAIVAGSAGAGAAIGAVASGGKGAAIGALSGGSAGFIYDRLTHNH